MRKGDHKKTNLYFRRRLYAQTFTIAVLVAGNVYWKEDRAKRKEYEKQLEEKKRLEKRDRWLHELEVRDEEEKAWKAKMAKRLQKREQGVEETVEEKAKGVTEQVAEKTQELKDKLSRDK